MLQEIDVEIGDLLLDPNNPRFISNLEQPAEVPDDQIEEKQERTLQRFKKAAPADDPDSDVTNISDLYASMRRIGYVGIDRIVIRQVGKTKKYLVLEGNRRVATVKSILVDYEKKSPPLDKPSAQNEIKAHLPSFRKVRAMLLDTQGLSKDQIQKKVAILLGIRHHGSLLPWDPLPSAFNIYSEYMEEKPKKDQFKFENTKARAVADRLCIQTGDVTGALRTYVVYLQLRERFPDIRDEHFSLIETGIKNKRLRASYLKVDADTFELDEQSLTKLNTLCQFATRDSKNPERTTNGKKKILPEPRHFNLFAKLVDKMQGAAHPAVKSYALDLIQRVENEEDLEMTVEHAVDDFTNFENRTRWADAVGKLLDKQAAEMPMEQYSGEGSDRGYKDELKNTLEPLSKIMNV